MFSTIIKELLAQKNVSQKDFLKELKIEEKTFSNRDRNTTDPIGNLPTSKNLLKIANYFDVSVDYLLERTTVPTVQKEKKNYSTYEQFLGMCKRKGVTPQQVFNDLNLPSFILVDWENGKTPQNDYDSLNLKSVLWAIANYFEENRVHERPNPFSEDAKAEYNLLQWFSSLSLYEKIKFVETLSIQDNVVIADVSTSQKNNKVSAKAIPKSE